MKELYPLSCTGRRSFLKYGYALEAARWRSKFGVTTIRDTFGPLPTLLALPDAIARGELGGPGCSRGRYPGWAGEYCAPDAAPPHRQWCDYFPGIFRRVELTLLYPDPSAKSSTATRLGSTSSVRAKRPKALLPFRSRLSPGY